MMTAKVHSPIDELKRLYNVFLKNAREEDLVVPYQLVTGRPGATCTKDELVAAIKKAFDWSVVGCHDEYIMGVPLNQKMALQEYRGRGYEYMNKALREGTMRFTVNIREVERELRTQEKDVTLDDLKAAMKDPEHFATVVYKTLKLEDIIKKSVKDSIAESMQLWVYLKDMTDIVHRAPVRKKNVILWRGESFARAYYPFLIAREKAAYEHGKRMRSLKAGDVVERSDFVSFSMDPVRAEQFSGPGCCMYKLNLPRDAPALFIETYTKPVEYEVVLPPGTRFDVVKVYDCRSTVSEDLYVRVIELSIGVRRSPSIGGSKKKKM